MCTGSNIEKTAPAYRSKAGTRRWPMVVFYTILDVAAVNALVIMQHTNPGYFLQPKKKFRRDFLMDLGLALVKPQIEARVAGNMAFQHKDVLKAMSIMLGRQVGAPTPAPAPIPTATKGRCFLCVKQARGAQYKPNTNNVANKTAKSWPRCNRKVCGTHLEPQVRLCQECATPDQ